MNEARRADGCAYPPRTINQLLAALQLYMLGENHLLPKFMDCHSAVFCLIHNACNSVYNSLHASCIGTSIHHTSIILEEEESKLWDCGLGPLQFICSSNPDCITYFECGSKINSGTLKDFRYENKQVPYPALPDEQQKCLVFTFLSCLCKHLNKTHPKMLRCMRMCQLERKFQYKKMSLRELFRR